MAVYILGGGTSAFLIAKRLRSQSYTQDIHIISQEIWLPYNRMQLPHFLRGKITVERVFFESKTWYLDHNVKLYSGIKAKLESGQIKLEAELLKPYPKDETGTLPNFTIQAAKLDQLHNLQDSLNDTTNLVIWAVGAQAVVPPEYSYLEGKINTWRTLDDTIKIKQVLRTGKKIALIGSSFISIELATSATTYDPSAITWLIKGSSFVRQGLHSEFQEVLEERWTTFSSIKPLFNSPLLSEKQNQDLRDFEVVLLGTGVEPNLDLFTNSNHGFQLQEPNLKNPSQYLAGDLLQLPIPELNQQVRCGSYHQAAKQTQYLVDLILTGKSISAESTNDLLNTPYQIQFAGKSLRMSGIVFNPLFLTEFQRNNEQIKQIWKDNQDRVVGYITYNL
jgi:Pyridine nucleotide-disulphide oxidoreductase